MNRRGFLSTMLAACAAPAIVRADSLMRIVPTEITIVPLDIPAEDISWVAFLHPDFLADLRAMREDVIYSAPIFGGARVVESRHPSGLLVREIIEVR